MVKHDNIHRIEWHLGVITTVYPDERGIIRTAEVEECGRRSLRPVTFLVPVELDCHQEDGEIRQRLRDDYDRNDNDDNFSRSVDSISKAGMGGGQGSSVTTADAEERSIPHDASHSESAFHRTPGSSRESSPATGTNTRCNITTEGDAGTPNTLSLPPSPTSSVDQQPYTSEGRGVGAGEPVIRSRQPRRAAQQQRDLMKSLVREDLL